MTKPKITLLVDNPKSWMTGYAKEFAEKLRGEGYDAVFTQNASEIPKGGIVCYLSCEKIYPKEFLSRNLHNLVVHASALPKGKGWSPLTWQILEGKNKIPITLFEATEKVDAGKIYKRGEVNFKGDELVGEMRVLLTKETFNLIQEFLNTFPNTPGKSQEGKESFYKKRKPEDSKLDPYKSIAEQFNLLRVVDNDMYPAFFYYLGKKYVLKIEKERDGEKS